MHSRDQLIRARLGILALATELRNVAKACKLAGVSRSQFYKMRKAFQVIGKEGLAPRTRRKPQMPNRTSETTEQTILLKTLESPKGSYVRLAQTMRSQGIGVTPTMIRYVWQRHGLSTRHLRLQYFKRRNGDSGSRKRDPTETNPMDPVRQSKVRGVPSLSGRAT